MNYLFEHICRCAERLGCYLLSSGTLNPSVQQDGVLPDDFSESWKLGSFSRPYHRWRKEHINYLFERTAVPLSISALPCWQQLTVQTADGRTPCRWNPAFDDVSGHVLRSSFSLGAGQDGVIAAGLLQSTAASPRSASRAGGRTTLPPHTTDVRNSRGCSSPQKAPGDCLSMPKRATRKTAAGRNGSGQRLALQ